MSKEPGYNIVLKVKDKKFWVKFRCSTVRFGRDNDSQLMTTCVVRPIGTLDIFSATTVCNPKDNESAYAGCRFALKKVVEQKEFQMLFEVETRVKCHTIYGFDGWTFGEGTMVILPNPKELWEDIRVQLWDKLGSKLVVPKE